MPSRRSILTTGAALTTSLAGCTTLTDSGPDPVRLLAAGSLTTALEHGLRPAVEVPLRVGTRGSAALARLIAAGTRRPHIVSVADPALFNGPLHPEWYAEFATNAMVLAYNPETPGGAAVAGTSPTTWWRPILNGRTRFGRTDPTLDPLGYRTLFTLDLASDHYPTAPDLRAQIPDQDQVYPETQLLAQFETGAIDAALTYRNMAIERGYEYIELPPAINLSDPGYTTTYRESTYRLPTGKLVYGDVIRYAATILTDTAQRSVSTVFDSHITGEYLLEYGFDRPATYPHYAGNVPPNLTP